MSRRTTALLRQLQSLAIRAGEAHQTNLEVAVMNAVRLLRYPPHVQGMLLSMQVMQFAVMDECLLKASGSEGPSG